MADGHRYESTDCRLNVTGDDGALLRQLAALDVRTITDQVKWLVRQEAKRRSAELERQAIEDGWLRVQEELARGE